MKNLAKKKIALKKKNKNNVVYIKNCYYPYI